MKQKFKKEFFLTIIIFIISFSIANPILRTEEKSIHPQKKLPILIKGDKIDYFDIIGDKGVKKKTELLRSGFSLIVIFSIDCISCNKNIPIWNRMSLIKGIKTYGIVMREEGIGDLRDIRAIKFKLYSPHDISKFKQNFDINEGIDYAILSKGDEVVFFKMGLLDPDDYFQIKNYMISR